MVIFCPQSFNRMCMLRKIQLLGLECTLYVVQLTGLRHWEMWNDTAAPVSICNSCLIVRSGRSSGWPFRPSCWAALCRRMVLSDLSSKMAYAFILCAPFRRITLTIFRRTFRLAGGLRMRSISLIVLRRQALAEVPSSGGVFGMSALLRLMSWRTSKWRLLHCLQR